MLRSVLDRIRGATPAADAVAAPPSAALLPPHSNNVKKRVNMEQLASGLNKQKVIEKVRPAFFSLLLC